jgi:hypothetical protein
MALPPSFARNSTAVLPDVRACARVNFLLFPGLRRDMLADPCRAGAALRQPQRRCIACSPLPSRVGRGRGGSRPVGDSDVASAPAAAAGLFTRHSAARGGPPPRCAARPLRAVAAEDAGDNARDVASPARPSLARLAAGAGGAAAAVAVLCAAAPANAAEIVPLSTAALDAVTVWMVRAAEILKRGGRARERVRRGCARER